MTKKAPTQDKAEGTEVPINIQIVSARNGETIDARQAMPHITKARAALAVLDESIARQVHGALDEIEVILGLKD